MISLWDFYSPECSPCKLLDKFLNTISDKIVIKKVNIKEDYECAMNHAITSLPTVIIKKDEKVIYNNSGFSEKLKSDILSFI